MSESQSACNDPFQEQREKGAVLSCPFQGEDLPMILRHADVRAAAKDWKTYSSDAPFRVPIPSEEEFRRMRQLPIETDPPQHTEYRKIVEPFFKRAKNPQVMANIEALIATLVDDALKQDSVEIVSEIALPLQSRALTHLLNLPESEADTWISWGIHVFGDKSDNTDGDALENYIEDQIDHASKDPGEDFFSALTQAQFQGRSLTREEMLGFANLTFAGGRDTIIHTVSSIFHHLGHHPEALDFLRADPKRIDLASEEYFRTISPLTHIGRVCPVDTDVHGTQVKAGDRVSLGWASANRDSTVFDQPHETQLNRKPNPHIAFGAGTHLCLGAPHARLLTRTLLRQLSQKISHIHILKEQPLVENEAAYQRNNGFISLLTRLDAC
ncbi:MAG: cytochrome P450 [Verrucomicrobiales bacterium]|nr:cytochrome P450 [Verrucomicrobiales bacterium]